MDPDGNDVAVHAEGEAAEEGHEDSHGDSHGDSEEQNCHFHAGVEYALPDFLFFSEFIAHNSHRHCVGGGSEEVSCGLREREYNVGLRIGSLFIVLVTSAIGVLAPLLLHKLVIGSIGANILMAVKQFGTGIIISTAFIHVSSCPPRPSMAFIRPAQMLIVCSYTPTQT